MSRRRSVIERAKRKAMRRKCPKCGTTNVKAKEYDDAWLYICQRENCGFPVREVKS